MEGIRGYILGITAAAMIISMLSSVTKAGGMIKLVGGTVLLIILLQPVAKIQFAGLETYMAQTFADGKATSDEGITIAKMAMADIIKAKTEAYILDKAGLYRAQIDVQIDLGGEEIPYPQEVTITGTWSPAAKNRLQEIIEAELGIPKEKQAWTGSK